MDPATSINHRWAARTLRGERMFHFGVQSRVTLKTRTRDAQQENKRTRKGVIFLLWFLFLGFGPAIIKKKMLKYIFQTKLSVSGHRRPAVVTQPLRLQCYGPLSPHSKSQMTDPTSTKPRCGFTASHFSAPLRNSAMETHIVHPCWESGRCGVAFFNRAVVC